jgi:hypothetical protein
VCLAPQEGLEPTTLRLTANWLVGAGSSLRLEGASGLLNDRFNRIDGESDDRRGAAPLFSLSATTSAKAKFVK